MNLADHLDHSLSPLGNTGSVSMSVTWAWRRGTLACQPGDMEHWPDQSSGVAGSLTLVLAGRASLVEA